MRRGRHAILACTIIALLAAIGMARSACAAAVPPGVQNVIGYVGYVFDPEIGGDGRYSVRYRQYRPDLQRWLQRDPIGYADGMNVAAPFTAWRSACSRGCPGGEWSPRP